VSAILTDRCGSDRHDRVLPPGRTLSCGRIERAKAPTFHYARTSHGSQIISGLEALRRENPKFDYTVYSGQPQSLPAPQGALRIYDGQSDETYITPELYWSDADGIQGTRAVADTGLFNFSMWFWCGEQCEDWCAMHPGDCQILPGGRAGAPRLHRRALCHR